MVILCFLRRGAIISIDICVPHSTSLILWNLLYPWLLHPVTECDTGLRPLVTQKLLHSSAFSVGNLFFEHSCSRNPFAKNRKLGKASSKNKRSIFSLNSMYKNPCFWILRPKRSFIFTKNRLTLQIYSVYDNYHRSIL